MPGKCSPSAVTQSGVGAKRGRTQSLFAYYMGHLRQKLEQDPARPRHFILKPVLGIGLCHECLFNKCA